MCNKNVCFAVTECKEKWKNLRTTFSRSRKPLPSGSSAKKKKYYLQDVMAFVSPFIKSRKQDGNLPSPTTETEDDIVDCTKNADVAADTTLDRQYDEIESVAVTEIPSDSNKERQHTAAAVQVADGNLPRRQQHPEKAQKKKQPHPPVSTSTVSDEADKCFIDFIKSQTITTTGTNADFEFLHSLLPDLSKMECRRKRKFKRSVLELIDNILAEQEDEAVRRTAPPSISPSSAQWDFSSPSLSTATPSPSSASIPVSTNWNIDHPSSSPAEYVATWNMS